MKASKGQKRPQFNKSENAESQGFIDHENYGYIPLPPLLPQRESNCLSNLSEETKSLTHPGKYVKKLIQEEVLTSFKVLR